MAEELTRKVLKVFGVALTDFEDRCAAAAQRARDEAGRGADPAEFLPILEELVRSTSEVWRRWIEVTQVIHDQHCRVHAEVLNLLDEAKTRKGRAT